MRDAFEGAEWQRAEWLTARLRDCDATYHELLDRSEVTSDSAKLGVLNDLIRNVHEQRERLEWRLAVVEERLAQRDMYEPRGYEQPADLLRE